MWVCGVDAAGDDVLAGRVHHLIDVGLEVDSEQRRSGCRARPRWSRRRPVRPLAAVPVAFTTVPPLIKVVLMLIPPVMRPEPVEGPRLSSFDRLRTHTTIMAW